MTWDVGSVFFVYSIAVWVYLERQMGLIGGELRAHDATANKAFAIGLRILVSVQFSIPSAFSCLGRHGCRYLSQETMVMIHSIYHCCLKLSPHLRRFHYLLAFSVKWLMQW